MSMLDLFLANPNAFSALSLSQALMEAPYTPGFFGDLGIFTEKGIPTTDFVLEYKGGVVSLIPNTKRGDRPQLELKQNRKALKLSCTHLPIYDSINADDVQNVRRWGSESELAGVNDLLADKMEYARQSLETTIEWQMAGAAKGIILDADGTTEVANLFTEFGLTQQTKNFTAATTGGNFKNVCNDIHRLIRKGLGGGLIPRGVLAVCGKTAFDKITANADVVSAFQKQGTEDVNINDVRMTGLNYGGIKFVEYPGGLIGRDPKTEADVDIPFVSDSAIHYIPLGIPNLFMLNFAPANYNETVNTIGQRMYFKIEPKEFGMGFKYNAQSNPLAVCTRPLALVKSTVS